MLRSCTPDCLAMEHRYSSRCERCPRNERAGAGSRSFRKAIIPLTREAAWSGAPSSTMKPSSGPSRGRCGCRHQEARDAARAAARLRDAPVQSVSDIRTVQELLGHADVATTMIDTHVLRMGAGRSPAPWLRSHVPSRRKADVGELRLSALSRQRAAPPPLKCRRCRNG
jgi:hypothetical protein